MRKAKSITGNIPVFNLEVQYKALEKELDKAVKRVFNSGHYILGKEVENFEKQFAKYIGTKYAVGVASGTDALTIAIKSLDLKENDEVIVPANVYPTIFGVGLAGVKIKLADVGPKSLLVDLENIKKVVTKKTKAIILVHLYGNAVDISPIKAFAKKRKIFLIEDCAQATGASYKGKKLGSIGDISCFSFYPTKNLGTYGDGGAILTNNQKLYNRALMLRMYGEEERYKSVVMGHNSRLDEIHAAILLAKLKYLNKWNKARRHLATFYLSGLKGLPVQVTQETKNAQHVYHLFTIQTSHRDRLARYLKEKGISTGIHYPVSIHHTPTFKYLKYKNGDFPVSEKASQELLSLPMYPELTKTSVQFVVTEIKKYFNQK
jgi:dTDP-4-amino-4,6-dideoxygalactose transaminase